MSEDDRSPSAGAGDDRDGIILARLREAGGELVSGNELARSLAISRAAVGKRVAGLRERGWSIEAVPNRGYRLVAAPGSLEPEQLTPLLSTRWLGRLYLFHPELGSTNAEAVRQARAGAPHGTVIAADRQSAGRGRLDRQWYSPPGQNIYASAVLRPGLDLAAAPLLSLAAAIGVAEGVRGFVGAPPVVKWPNDLLYGARKVSGILLDLALQGDKVQHVVLGIGVNVNTTDFPGELAASATSLMRERGEPVRRALVLASVLNRVEPWIDRLIADGPLPVAAAWRELAPWLGDRVTVRVGERALSGIARDITAEGALEIETDAGVVERVNAGDVKLGPRRG